MRKFFHIVYTPRVGSQNLARTLDQHPDIFCEAEPQDWRGLVKLPCSYWNQSDEKREIGHKVYSLLQSNLESRILYQCVGSKLSVRMVDFNYLKVFNHHKTKRFIYLYRENLFDQAISVYVANVTSRGEWGNWHSIKPIKKSKPFRGDINELLRIAEFISERKNRSERFLNDCRSVLRVPYKNTFTHEGRREIFRFLGVRNVELNNFYVRRNKNNKYSSLITNYKQLETKFSKSRYH